MCVSMWVKRLMCKCTGRYMGMCVVCVNRWTCLCGCIKDVYVCTGTRVCLCEPVHVCACMCGLHWLSLCICCVGMSEKLLNESI
jgi:hypothetical protein